MDYLEEFTGENRGNEDDQKSKTIEELIENRKKEIRGDFWIEKKKRADEKRENYSPQVWDFKLSNEISNLDIIGSAYAESEEKDVKSLFKNGFHEPKDTICVCGYANSIKNCPQCHQWFCCDRGKGKGLSKIQYQSPANSDEKETIHDHIQSCKKELQRHINIPLSSVQSILREQHIKDECSEIDNESKIEMLLKLKNRESYNKIDSEEFEKSLVSLGASGLSGINVKHRKRDVKCMDWSELNFENDDKHPDRVNCEDVQIAPPEDIQLNSNSILEEDNEEEMNISTESTEPKTDIGIDDQPGKSTRSIDLPHEIQNFGNVNINHLKRGPTIGQLWTKAKNVYVTHWYSPNRIHVVPASVFQHDLVILKEDIYEIMVKECGGRRFIHIPAVDTVLLAPLDGIYHRAVVEDVCADDFLQLRFLDIGSKAKSHLNCVYKINEDLLKLPILGLEITLTGVTSSELQFILPSEANEYISKWPEYRLCTVTSFTKGNGDETGTLVYVDKGMKINVSNEIVEIGKWKWEETWEKMTENKESILCDISHWKEISYDDQVRRIPNDKKIKGTVVLSDPEMAEIVLLLNIDTEDYYYDKIVLQKQFERYVKIVSGNENFLPAVDEYILVYLLPTEDENLKNLRGIGKWNRCCRQGHTLFNFDEFEFYPLSWRKENFYIIRKYCPDFTKVPFFVAHCCVVDCLPMNERNKKIFKKIAPLGRVVTVTGLDNEGYNVSCQEFNDIK